ncbi:MAG TPA: GGDEF domain-containing protein [Burkholderiales bacterium]|nr:GGDEF domain-containing protein [Burkholderiales bacterium]
MVKKTEESLLQQLRIDGIEIARRKDLFGFGPPEAALLTYARSYVLPELDSVVEEFYRRQTAVEDVALIIGDSETMRRLRIAQRRYVDDLFSGVYDEEYVNNRLRIGLVHKRIGVEPKYYLSAVSALKEVLHGVIGARIPDAARASKVKDALDKLLYWDTAFVFDTYIRSMLSEIEAAKEGALRYAHSLEQRVAERTRELEVLSRHDALTGALNRHAFTEALHREITRAKRAATPLALLYIDIDDFKAINDAQGHQRGDEVLQLISKSLKDASREIDIIARVGGDEFCVVLPGVDEEGANAYRKRFTGRLAACCKDVEVSIGICVAAPDEHLEPDAMVSAADSRMYNEKSLHHNGEAAQGKNGGPVRAGEPARPEKGGVVAKAVAAASAHVLQRFDMSRRRR